MEREYVVVCMRHKGVIKDALLFWGEYTQDCEKRSFGGYTVDVDKCEKYTIDELSNYKFKVWGVDFDGHIPRSIDDFAIKVDDLLKLGYCKYTIIA